MVIFGTLFLTLIGSFAAQVNAIILKYTVDEVNALVEDGKGLQEGASILLFISIVLIGKELVNAFITFGQNIMDKSYVSMFLEI